MTIVKHGERTVRKGCKFCGSKDLYWAHDTAVSGPDCDKCAVSGKFLLIGRDGLPHVLSCPAAKAADREAYEGAKPAVVPAVPDVVDTPDVAPVAVPEIPVEAPNVPSSTVAPAAPTNDALAAFQALIGSMVPAAPAIDAAEIERIIRAKFDEVVFPTRTVVQRPDGTVKPVDGKTHRKVADIITDLLAGEHVMMVGPAGTGKSTIAEQAAEALGLEYGSLSLSPMTPTSAILGYMQATGEYVGTLFRERYENGGVFHFDEIDNSHPSTLAVVNAALANGAMAFPDGMVKRHADFRAVASANTYGKGADRQYVGRQALDAATLDRFTIETIEIDEALETDLCMATGLDSDTVKRVLTTVRKYRANAVAKRMAVVLSPRATVGMCKLLAAGRSWDDALEARVRRGMSDADWSKLTG